MPRPPFTILEFVGQKRALAPILREQDGALARGEPSPHILFSGQSGLGKSRAAAMLAQRAKSTCHKFNGTERQEEVVERLNTAKHGDIAFFDECHKLSDVIQEMLYEVIDSCSNKDGSQSVTIGKESITVPPITLAFATDQPGRLQNALVKRIPSHVHFEPYPEGELKEIVSKVAVQKNLLLSPQAAKQLALVCNGLPRRAEHHVLKLRLYFDDSEQRQLGREHVREYLKARGVDDDGFGKAERKYLRFLEKNRSASIESLAAYLGTDKAFVRHQIEQPLRYRGLITIRSSGRVLTSAGRRWLQNRRQSHSKKESKA